MKYKGYEIRDATFRPPTSRMSVPAHGIYDEGKLLAYVESVALAKRAIDAHTRSGIWKKREDSNGEA